MAKTFEHDAEFVEFIKEYVSDRLDELEDRSIYGCDLGHELSLDVNNDLSLMWKNDDDALGFIAKYPKSALATVDCVKWHFGAEGIEFMMKNWRTFAFHMLWEGCNCIAAQIPTVEDNWDDEFELSGDVVSKMKCELAKVESIVY